MKIALYVLFSIFGLVAVYFRISNLDAYSLWQDELAVYFHTQRSVDMIWSYSQNYSYHPPLLYYFLKTAYFFTGFGTVNLKIFHVAVGLVASLSPVAFLKNNRLKSLVFSFLLLINFNLILWSKEAHTYSVLFLLEVLFIIFLEKFEQINSWSRAIVVSILLFIISFYNYLLLILAACILIFEFVTSIKDRNKFKKYLMIILGPFILYIPWIYQNHLFKTVINPQKNIGFWNPPLETLSSGSSHFLETFNNSYFYFTLVVFLLFYGLIKQEHKKIYTSILMGSVMFVFFLLASSFNNFSLFISKYLNLIIPVVMYLCASVLSKIKLNKAFICLLVFTFLNFIDYNQLGSKKINQDIRGALTFLSKQSKGRKIFVSVYNSDWYRPYMENIIGERLDIIYQDTHCPRLSQNKSFLDQLVQGDFIYFNSDECNPTEKIEYLKGRGFSLVETLFIPRIRVFELL